MFLVFTDLDGTLLDPVTYSWADAEPALAELARRGIACVLVTSKTRAEVQLWRERLGNRDPFIVENGAAAFIPEGYFPFPVAGAIAGNGFERLEWGTPYGVLVRALEDASQSSGCRVVGFHQMGAQEISAACGLSLEDGALAARREYDEPFHILDAAREPALLRELEARGLEWTEGGRFHHVHGKHGKAVAVLAVTHLFGLLHQHLTTIGLGDAWNDAGFLEAVDIPIVVRTSSAHALASRVPRAVVTADAGPRGWNTAILNVIESRR